MTDAIAAHGSRVSARVFEERLASAPVLAIIRHSDPSHTPRALRALADAGILIAEVTTTTRGWADLVREMDPRILPGAGSVTSVEQVDDAYENGARFIVSPGLDRGVVDRTLALGMEPIPGCFTATEVQSAHRLGVRTVKLYPASLVGPAYLSALRAPFPSVRLLPTGGVTVDSIAQWMASGAVGVALGSELAGRTSSDDAGDLRSMVSRARDALARAGSSAAD